MLLTANSAGAVSSEALVLAAVETVRAKHGLGNIYTAPSLARLLAAGITSGEALNRQLPGLAASAGLWLAAVPQRDPVSFTEAGYNGRLAATDAGTAGNACALLKAASGAAPFGIVLDADMSEAGDAAGAVAGDNAVRRLEDAEYLEASWLAQCLGA